MELLAVHVCDAEGIGKAGPKGRILEHAEEDEGARVRHVEGVRWPAPVLQVGEVCHKGLVLKEAPLGEDCTGPTALTARGRIWRWRPTGEVCGAGEALDKLEFDGKACLL